jgi:hypothetical protein
MSLFSPYIALGNFSAQESFPLLLSLVFLLAVIMQLRGERPSSEDVVAPSRILLRIFMGSIVLAFGSAVTLGIYGLCGGTSHESFGLFEFLCHAMPAIFLFFAFAAILILRKEAH